MWKACLWKSETDEYKKDERISVRPFRLSKKLSLVLGFFFCVWYNKAG